jgi:hypothetical protein
MNEKKWIESPSKSPNLGNEMFFKYFGIWNIIFFEIFRILVGIFLEFFGLFALDLTH